MGARAGTPWCVQDDASQTLGLVRSKLVCPSHPMRPGTASLSNADHLRRGKRLCSGRSHLPSQGSLSPCLARSMQRSDRRSSGFRSPFLGSPPSTVCPYGTVSVQKPWPVLIAGMIADAVPGSSCCNWVTPALSFVLQSPSVRDGGARANEASLGHPYAVLSWPWSGLSMVGKGFLGRGRALRKACLLRPPGSWRGPYLPPTSLTTHGTLLITLSGLLHGAFLHHAFSPHTPGSAICAICPLLKPLGRSFSCRGVTSERSPTSPCVLPRPRF